MCGQGEFYGHRDHGGCCCQSGGFQGRPFGRHFPSREERVSWLKEHLKEIQAEAKEVEERLAEIKAAG